MNLRRAGAARARRAADRSRRAAFTLIELMVVVGIVAIVAAAAAPSIGAGIRDRKASTATLDVVRTFRGARSAAAGYGRAYLVRFVEAENDGQGTMVVLRGNTNRCNGANWDLAPQIVSLGYSALNHVGMDTSFRLMLRVVPAAANLDLCYEPSGLTYWRTAQGGRFSTTVPADAGQNPNGGFRFSIDRQSGGQPEGVTRFVVVPLGGDARVMR